MKQWKKKIFNFKIFSLKETILSLQYQLLALSFFNWLHWHLITWSTVNSNTWKFLANTKLKNQRYFYSVQFTQMDDISNNLLAALGSCLMKYGFLFWGLTPFFKGSLFIKVLAKKKKKEFKYILKHRGIWKYRIMFLFEVTSHRQHICTKIHMSEATAVRPPYWLYNVTYYMDTDTHTHTCNQYLWERLVAGLNDYLPCHRKYCSAVVFSLLSTKWSITCIKLDCIYFELVNMNYFELDCTEKWKVLNWSLFSWI